MVIGSYESVMFQHRFKHLCFALWADNNIVKTLSNFHMPRILPVGFGVSRRRRIEGVRERDPTEVTCPEQQKAYSETFHLIDKGNGKEKKYDMTFNSKGHNWAPKITMRFWNFYLGNAHTMYSALVHEHTPGHCEMDMSECVRFLCHSLLQRGERMRRQCPEHPKPFQDLDNVFDPKTGRKMRSDAKGAIGDRVSDVLESSSTGRLCNLESLETRAQWRSHQSVACGKKGKCCWEHCPGYKKTDRKRLRSNDTRMICEECSVREKRNVYLCNSPNSGDPILCHIAYHTRYYNTHD